MIVGLVYRDVLSISCLDGAGNQTDAQIRRGLEEVARVKRVAEGINTHKILTDLRRELVNDDDLSLCDNGAMVIGKLSQYIQENNLKDVLSP